MLLEGERIKLRAVEAEDLPLLYQWENDTTLWGTGNTVSPYSNYTLQEYIDNASVDIFTARQLRLMITLKSQNITIGNIDLFELDPRHRRCGVGVLICKEFQNQGYAVEALQALQRYAFGFLYLKQLYAHIPASNEVSIHLFKRCGFEQTGVCKQWLLTPDGTEDVVFMQCLNIR